MSSMSATPLVERYKKKFHLPAGLPLDEDMVLGHWNLERRLAGELLASNPENRWDIFAHCYTTLYRECPWLNLDVSPDSQDNDTYYRHFLTLLAGAKDIYEIGSGRARLLNYLARRGFRCVASEITRERGERYADPNAIVQWHSSDGVNLARFEAAESFDAVISSHVVEHFHPDDLLPHLENVHTILRPGGRYVLAMPHRFAGPMDLSEVFGLNKPVCMHLREYSWRETVEACRQAGFIRLEAAYVAPQMLRRILRGASFSGRGYLRYVLAMEAMLDKLPNKLKQALTKRGTAFLFRPEILIIAHKG